MNPKLRQSVALGIERMRNELQHVKDLNRIFARRYAKLLIRCTELEAVCSRYPIVQFPDSEQQDEPCDS